jgi:hypothetical protein
VHLVLCIFGKYKKFNKMNYSFFFFRYTQPPNELFEWFEEYLDDTEVN